MKPSKPKTAAHSTGITLCPHCKHPTNRSRARGLERAFRAFGLVPRRCRNCSRRFLARRSKNV